MTARFLFGFIGIGILLFGLTAQLLPHVSGQISGHHILGGLGGPGLGFLQKISIHIIGNIDGGYDFHWDTSFMTIIARARVIVKNQAML